MHTEKAPKTKVTALHIIALVLCVLFGLMLVNNLVIIIKGAVNPDAPPSVLGVTPLVVQSGSMSGTAKDHIEVGDLIFVTRADTSALKAGDVIAFKEGSIVVTHRIVRVETAEDGSLSFVTKGDANNTEDIAPVAAENVVGIYKTRIPALGDVAMFMQKPVGMAIFIGIPVLAFVLYDSAARRRAQEAEKRRADELQRELERLKHREE